MEVLRSVVVDSTPSLTAMLKFGCVEALRGLKSLFLFYPLNVFLLCLLVFVTMNRLSSSIFKRKTQFKAVYAPLPHHESPLEDIKLVKKEIRQVQSDLIALLRHGSQDSQSIGQPAENSADMSEGVKEFLNEVKERSSILEEVESELKQAVSEAFNQILKMNEV